MALERQMSTPPTLQLEYGHFTTSTTYWTSVGNAILKLQILFRGLEMSKASTTLS